VSLRGRAVLFPLSRRLTLARNIAGGDGDGHWRLIFHRIQLSAWGHSSGRIAPKMASPAASCLVSTYRGQEDSQR